MDECFSKDPWSFPLFFSFLMHARDTSADPTAVCISWTVDFLNFQETCTMFSALTKQSGYAKISSELRAVFSAFCCGLATTFIEAS